MNSLPKILYVEDDESLSFITSDSLRRKGFDVITSGDGMEAFELFSNSTFDICLFDVMLPKMDGFDLAHKVRSKNKEIPILFLTAKTLPEDRIKGLLVGADDYIVKPYTMDELILRINVFLKRSKINELNTQNQYISIGNAKFDKDKLELISDNERASLTYREAELLLFFLENRNTILSRERILNLLWGDNDYFAGRSLDVFITRLRKHFKNNPKVSIENKHRVGFVFKIAE